VPNAMLRGGISTTALIAIIIVVVAIIGILAYFLMAPGTPGAPPTTTATTPTTVKPAKKFRVAVVVGGDKTDLGWNYKILTDAEEAAKAFGWELTEVTNVPFPQQEAILRNLAASGKYDMIIVGGNQFVSVIAKVAKDYPNVKFVQIPGWIQNATSNLVQLNVDFQVNGYYLAGILAGKMTKTGRLAVVIGQWFPPLSMEYHAFKAGVESVNPNATVWCVVAGTWTDPNLGMQIALSLIKEKKVDIIAQIADATGRGVFAAAMTASVEYNGQKIPVKVIGTVADQVFLAPQNTLVSVMLNFTKFYEYVYLHIVKGTWDKIGGKIISMDLSYLSSFHAFEKQVPDDVKQLLAEAAEKIAKGEIKVPRIVTKSCPNPPPP